MLSQEIFKLRDETPGQFAVKKLYVKNTTLSVFCALTRAKAHSIETRNRELNLKNSCNMNICKDENIGSIYSCDWFVFCLLRTYLYCLHYLTLYCALETSGTDVTLYILLLLAAITPLQ